MNPLWTRRTFLSNATLSAASTALPSAFLSAQSAASVPSLPRPTAGRALAFIAHRKLNGPAVAIHTVSVQGNRWTVCHPSVYPERRPELLALHPTLAVLYAASAAEPARALPAVVTSFTFDHTAKGTPDLSRDSEANSRPPWLQPLNERPLAHATTRPHDLAITPDGRYLLLADRHGQLNLLPLGSSGEILPLQHVRKLTGSGHTPRSLSRPSSMLVAPDGQIAYVADPGANQIAVLSLAGEDPELLAPLLLPPRFAPTHLALHPSGRLLASNSAASSSVALFPLDATGSAALAPLTTHALSPLSATTGALTFSPDGDHLFVTAHQGSGPRRRSYLHVLEVDAQAPKLMPRKRQSLAGAGASGRLSVFSSHLLYADEHVITALHLDAGADAQSSPVVVHPYPALSNVVLQPA